MPSGRLSQREMTIGGAGRDDSRFIPIHCHLFLSHSHISKMSGESKGALERVSGKVDSHGYMADDASHVTPVNSHDHSKEDTCYISRPRTNMRWQWAVHAHEQGSPSLLALG